FIENLELSHQSWWQTLEIKPGWEDAFETITQHWHNAQLLPQSTKQKDLIELPGSVWLFENDYIDNHSSNIAEDSIATKLNNRAVPNWITNIMCAVSLESALAILPKLASHQSVVTQEGYWLGQGWMVVGSAEQQSGLLKRANQIKQLEVELDLVQNKLLQAEEAVNEEEHKLAVAKRNAETGKQQFEHLKLNLQQTRNQTQLLVQQQQQNVGRNTRLSQELVRQQQTLEQEQLQLEELSLQAEELEQTVEHLQEQQREFELNREQQQQKVLDNRTQTEATKNKLHQLALHLQTVRSQHQGLTDSQQREVALLTNMQQKLQLLNTEFAELAMPLEDQQDSLQQLLEQKAILDIQQQELNDKLANIQEKLSVAEKGQQGVTDKIQVMLSELQSIKLECEGYRVRANGVLDQLQEMQQNLKSVLESLPEDSNEKTWQNHLDKTVASVARLGAVNLAAVEEYDIQAERK
ncbi:MAG: hypothetical protein ABJM47_09750, partial [Lentilitoribacter sp.]